MTPSSVTHRRFYRDGPDWANTPEQHAAEKAYREAFLKAAREAAGWPAPDKEALRSAWTQRRQTRRNAESDVDGGIVTDRPGHETDAAQARGRVQGFEFVHQCWRELETGVFRS